MNCKAVENRLQEFLDSAIGAQEAKQVKSHLKACVSCARQYRGLKLVVESISCLPYYSPTPAFNEKVLSALGYEQKPKFLPQWVLWAEASLGSLMACWMAGVILLISSRLTLWKTIGAAKLAANPSQVLLLFKLYLAKAALMLGDLLATFRALDRLFGPETTNMPFELAVAAVVAGIFMAVVSQKAPMSAATRKWRTV